MTRYHGYEYQSDELTDDKNQDVRPARPVKEPKLSQFFSDYRAPSPDSPAPSLNRTLDTVIKRPGEISYAILESKSTPIRFHLLAIFMLCALSYGLIMASFSGGMQWVSTPARLLAGWLFSALICLPSLHVFSSLSGGRQSLLDAAGVVLQSMTLHAIIMLAFSPVIWLFSQSTDGVLFMGVLHLCAWFISAIFALSIIKNAFLVYNGIQSYLWLWTTIFVLVSMQMSATLRPLVGEFDGWELNDKLFFLKHWLSEMAH
jgi:hypothetical protein